MEEMHMEPPRHILLCGKRQVGKSTLIRRLLAHVNRPVCGFVTRADPAQADGARDIRIYPARAGATQSHLVGRSDGRSRIAYPDVFETIGVAYLQNIPHEGIILMDELGFLEAGAPGFCRAVLGCLQGDIPVIAAIKARTDIPFLEQVRACPKAAVYTITEENRDDLYAALLPRVLRLNRTGASG